MGQNKQTWIWVLGCGLAGLGLMACVGVFAAAAALITIRQISPTRVAEENTLPPQAIPLEETNLLPDTSPPLNDNSLSVNRIVYIDADGQIITIAPDGQDARQITEGNLRFQFPAWSPDGQHLAAIAGNRQGGGVFVLEDVADSPQIELYRNSSNYPIYLYWSPNGQQVSFLAGHEEEGSALHLANADGSTTNTLVSTGSPFYWDWLNDGLQLFVHSGVTGNGARLTLMDTAGNADAVNLAEPGYFQSPGLSATGRYLAYGSVANNQHRLVIQDRETQEEVSVQHQGFVALSWSPVAEQLAFTSPMNREDVSFGPLRLMTATTGAVQELDTGPVFAFFWSPDGQAIAYLTFPSTQMEDEVQLPGKGVWARPQLQHDELQLELRVVNVATGQRRILLQFAPTDLFLTQFLPFFDQYALSHSLWSPTSDALVLPALDKEGDPYLLIAPLDGSLPRPLAEGVMAFWSQQ
ncbi:MAG: PD40 domain-containing protein [Chloroflexi bacterium]|nr:PD40 domain-containing protein [Chloroflexota bacterium]MBP8058121.1 PD40 domain-containing protein [Chloroflexota bacterium]